MKSSFSSIIAVAFACACTVAPASPPDASADQSLATEAAAVTTKVVESASATSTSAAYGSRRPRREYTDARWYFTNDADINAWYVLTYELEDAFDDICGDTFCEGEYSNYQSLGIRCSVEKRSGTLGTCIWTFAASQDEVVAATGDITVSTATFRCKLPLARDTPVSEFLGVLGSSSDGSLYARLPRSEASIFDGLADCL